MLHCYRVTCDVYMVEKRHKEHTNPKFDIYVTYVMLSWFEGWSWDMATPFVRLQVWANDTPQKKRSSEGSCRRCVLRPICCRLLCLWQEISSPAVVSAGKTLITPRETCTLLSSQAKCPFQDCKKLGEVRNVCWICDKLWEIWGNGRHYWDIYLLKSWGIFGEEGNGVGANQKLGYRENN